MTHQQSGGLGRLAYGMVVVAPPLLGLGGWLDGNVWMMLAAPLPLLLAVPLLLWLEGAHRGDWQETHYDGLLRGIGIALALCFVVPVVGTMAQISTLGIAVVLGAAELVVFGSIVVSWRHFEDRAPVPESVFGLYGLQSKQQARSQRGETGRQPAMAAARLAK